MRYAFVRPDWYPKWTGELKAIQDLQEGLKLFGHDSFVTTYPYEACAADAIFFIGTATDHNPDLHLMQILKRDYGSVSFHEDKLLFTGASYGFFHYVQGILEQRTEKDHRFALEDLIERPHLIFYFDEMKLYNALTNYEFLKNARVIIAESHTEDRTLQRDVPGCNSQVVYWTSGHTYDLEQMPDDAFLRYTGLKSGSYILQTGRFELRKNQLATLLATKDLDIPVVFIAMPNCNPTYEKLFLAAAAKWRKAPTIVISQHLTKEHSSGHLQVIPTPNGEILTKGLLLSAFSHAGLHLHPSFYELPGYTYLETARFGIPTIASQWSSLKDYFTDDSGRYTLDDRVEYALPYDLGALKKLVEKKFGQKYPQEPLHPIFLRGVKDVARDFLHCTQGYP